MEVALNGGLGMPPIINFRQIWARIRTTIHAKLNIPAESLPCTVVDLSAGGAAMKLVVRALQQATKLAQVDAYEGTADDG